MEISRNGSRPSGKGPAEWFTGDIRIDPLFQADEPARVAGASVTFEPGAHRRTGRRSRRHQAGGGVWCAEQRSWVLGSRVISTGSRAIV